MISNTKSKLDSETIRRILTFHFKDVDVESIDELKGGMFNSAYVIRLKQDINGFGKNFVLKVSVSPTTKVLTYEKDLMDTEVLVYKKLSAAGIPVPQIIAEDFSQTIIPYNYFMMTKLSGAEWQQEKKHFRKQDYNDLKFELGVCLAKIHANKGKYFGYIKKDERFHFPTWREAFSAMLKDIVDDGKRDNVKLPFDKIMAAVNPFMPLLDEIKTPSLVNFDLWAKNIFVKRKGGRYYIEGIIDHERSFYGDPFADFIASFAIYNDITREQAIRKGYESVTGSSMIITKNDEIRMYLYRIYLALIQGVEIYRYSKIMGLGQLFYSRFLLANYLRALKKFKEQRR